ncbi:MAG: hypothetical protein AAF458_01110 [Pseudomonadota bacterium]
MELVTESDAVAVVIITACLGAQPGLALNGIDTDCEGQESERLEIRIVRCLKGAWAGSVIHVSSGLFGVNDRCLVFQRRVGGYDAYELLHIEELSVADGERVVTRTGELIARS